MRPGGASGPKLNLLGFRVSSWVFCLSLAGAPGAPKNRTRRISCVRPRSPRLVLAQGSGWELGWSSVGRSGQASGRGSNCRLQLGPGRIKFPADSPLPSLAGHELCDVSSRLLEWRVWSARARLTINYLTTLTATIAPVMQSIGTQLAS